MRTNLRPIAIFLAVLAAPQTVGATAPASSHDSHPLSTRELATFLPGVCRHPLRAKKEFSCEAFIGYGGDPAPPRGTTLSLDAVAYASFTRPGEREAYLSYASDFEPHANNFGGGIVLRRSGEAWKVVAWFPGGQMKNCMAVPGIAPQRMLCLDGYEGMGEMDSSVWIKQVRPAGGDGHKDTGVLKAQDGREAENAKYYCGPAVRTHTAMLLSIDDLKRSTDEGAFAVSNIIYAAAPDVARACQRGDLQSVVTRSAKVRYRWTGNRIAVQAPVAFAEVDY